MQIDWLISNLAFRAKLPLYQQTLGSLGLPAEVHKTQKD